jgi:hypothetical protein
MNVFCLFKKTERSDIHHSSFHKVSYKIISLGLPGGKIKADCFGSEINQRPPAERGALLINPALLVVVELLA